MVGLKRRKPLPSPLRYLKHKQPPPLAPKLPCRLPPPLPLQDPLPPPVPLPLQNPPACPACPVLLVLLVLPHRFHLVPLALPMILVESWKPLRLKMQRLTLLPANLRRKHGLKAVWPSRLSNARCTRKVLAVFRRCTTSSTTLSVSNVKVSNAP